MAQNGNGETTSNGVLPTRTWLAVLTALVGTGVGGTALLKTSTPDAVVEARLSAHDKAIAELQAEGKQMRETLGQALIEFRTALAAQAGELSQISRSVGRIETRLDRDREARR